MGICYSGVNIAEDHIHTDIRTGKITKPQQKYHIGTVSYGLQGCRAFTGFKPSLFALQWFETFGLQEGFLIHKRINTGSKQITIKTYDESVMKFRQKQRIVIPGDP